MSRGQEHRTGLIITGDASGGIRAMRATESELGKLNQGFNRGSRYSRQFNQDVNSTSQGLAVLRRAAAPIAGLVAGMFAANTLQGQINWADQLQKTNLRIGASTEALSEYNYVANLSGVEFNALTTAWQRQTRRIAEAAQGTGVAAGALKQLGLEARELNQLAPEEQFERIAAAMQGVEDASERVRLAQKLWDSGGVRLLQIVNSGTDAIAAMRAEANALGLTISQETADAMATYNDEVARLQFAAQGLTQTMLAQLVPSLTQGLQSANEFVQGLGGAEVVVGHLTDGAQVLAALLAGRYAGAFATATAAKLAATQQSIAYQIALARMAGVSTTVVAGQTALAASIRGVSGALALVGGPAGAAVIAVGALYYFREELGLVDVAAQNATDALDANSDAIRDGSAAALDASYDNLVNALEAVSLQAQEAMAQLTELEARQAFYENSHKGMADSVSGAIDQQTEALAELWARQVELQRSIRENRAARENATQADSRANVVLEDLVVTTNTAAAASREAAKQTTTLANSYENLLDRIQPNRRAARQYAQDVGVLNLALATGRINAVRYMQAMGMLQESFQAAQRETEQLADATERAAFTMEGAWDEVRLNGLRRLDDGLADLWQGAIDGSRSASETMKRVLNQTLAEMAHMAITRPIIVQFAVSMGMGGGVMGGGGMGGMGGFSPASMGSALNALRGGVGGIQWAGAGGAQAYGGAGWANAATSGTGATGFMGGSLQNFSGMQGLAGLGAGFAGNWLGGQLFGQGTHSNTLGALGGSAGTFFGGPLGALAGSTLGSALGGLFGGSWKTQDGGLNLGVSGGDITGNQYEQQRRSGGLFRSSRSRTVTSALDSEFEAALQQAYSAQEASLAMTLEVLGQQSSSLNAFSTGLTKISTKGKSEAEVEKAVQDWLQNTVNRAAQSVVDPSEYAMAGETTVETLNRLATALTGVNPLLEQLHDFTYEASLSGGAAAAHLLELAGGLDALAARTQYYYDNILTEAQRHEISMKRATQAMGAFTAQTGHIINSTDQLYELVEGIDRNTEAGRALYVAALDLAPALVEVERGLERVRDRFADMLRDAESALSSAEQQARSAWQAFDNQAYRQQLALLGLMGDEQAALALQRERELQSIDPLLHETQRRIWAMQDETAAQNEATQAAQRYISELSRVRDQLASSLGSISQWVDQQRATGSTPGTNLGEAQAQFARQLVLAESGDRNALQSITQYADQVLQANDAYNASSAAGQRVRDDVLAALEGLPDAISDAEFIVNGFRDIVSNEMAREIERAIFSSQYKIDTLIEFAANATDLPADLRTILGEQAHRLDSTINYLLGENQLDAELRQLALLATNNLVATVDYITGSTLSTSDKMLALSSSNIMTAVIDFVLGSDIDRASRVLALESSNKYTSMIDMILGRDIHPDDRRLALDSTHRYASLIDYVVRSELTGGNRRLALSSLNEYDALIDYATRADITRDDRRLALDNGNRYLSTMDYIVGRDIDDGSKEMALASSNRYLSTINFLLGRDITGDDRTLALETANRFDAAVRYIVQAPLTGGERRLALSAGQTFDALVQYYTDNTLTEDERRMALESANRYISTMDYVMGRDIDDGSRAMALGSTNRYISTVNLIMGSTIALADRRLALESANRFDAVVRYVVDSPLTGGDRRLALSAGQHYEALIGYYVDADVSRQDRQLALNSGNQYLSMIDLVLGKNLSADNRRLALSSNNRFVSIIDTVIGKRITGGDRRLALNSTNLYTTIVDAVFANGISADVRTLALSNTNAIMATIDGVLASNMDGDVKTLALQQSNTFLTTLHTALADGRLSADERRVLDAQSESIVKTLRTGGNLNLSADEWAVINAASGTRRLELLADVAFGRTDLDHLADIDDNTKPLAEQARDQLKELTGLVGEMSRTTDQFVGLNSNIVSLRDSINALGVAQAEVARIERERAAAEQAERERIERERSVQEYISQAARFDAAAAMASQRAETLSGRIDSRDADNITRLIDRRMDDGVFTHKEWEDMLAHLERVFGRNSNEYLFGREYAAAYRNQTQADAERAKAARINGSHATGLWNVPFDGYIAELHRDEMVVPAHTAGRLRELPMRDQPQPLPLPNFPLLDRNDQHELMRDLLNENKQLRKELSARLDKIEKHGAAGVAVQQAGFNGQISEAKKSNRALEDMASESRLRGAL